MPKATSNVSEVTTFDLKSCEGGFIKARRLTYGEKLQRRAMVSGMKFQTEKGKKDFQGEMNLVSEQATMFDFERCIVEHNLEDEDGRLLNLSSISDVRKLDPRIGEEIDEHLSSLNNFEEDEGN
jgi:hypothetical protein